VLQRAKVAFSLIILDGRRAKMALRLLKSSQAFVDDTLRFQTQIAAGLEVNPPQRPIEIVDALLELA
jgi:hypothetical protein